VYVACISNLLAVNDDNIVGRAAEPWPLHGRVSIRSSVVSQSVRDSSLSAFVSDYSVTRHCLRLCQFHCCEIVLSLLEMEHIFRLCMQRTCMDIGVISNGGLDSL